jgi:hypothetical protein
MRRSIEFLIYVAGVVFFSWNYYELKSALDFITFLIFAAMYLFGVSRLATFASARIVALIHRNTK